MRQKRLPVGFSVLFAVLAGLAAYLVAGRLMNSETRNTGTELKTARKPRIVSMAPASTSILVSLGVSDALVAVDTWSGEIHGVPADAVRFDMMKPDAERLAALEPDILIVSAITQAGTSKDPFKPLEEAGVRVLYLPTSTSIEEIRADVRRIAELSGRAEAGTELIAQMDSGIERIAKVARTIPGNERRSVVFEISPAPTIYSFGSGVYLDELLETAGAVNALGKESGWIAVSAEAVMAADPDVILTNASFGEDPVAEIRSRPGWSHLKAVRTGRVFYIDNAASSQPAPGVVTALGEIAKAVYPEYFR
jgi:ABC-type Fe3+-hydroxamate transport system, periplasmic component